MTTQRKHTPREDRKSRKEQDPRELMPDEAEATDQFDDSVAADAPEDELDTDRFEDDEV